MSELAIDTAGAGCSAALCVLVAGERKIFTRFEAINRGHAEHILQQVEDLLEEAAIGYQSLNKIMCTMGPGSFTGVRIGIALAKGLALSCDVPLLGVSRTVVAGFKFTGLQDHSPLHERFCCVIDAGRCEFYVQLFNRGASGVVQQLSEPELLGHSDVASFVNEFEIQSVFGSGALVFRDLFESNLLGTGLKPVKGEDKKLIALPFESRAEDLFELDDRLFVLNEKVRPLYLRAPDAKPQVGKALVRRLL